MTLSTFLLVVAVFPLAPAAALPICDHGQPASGCVVDGDTLWTRGVKVRLIATDAPETDHASCQAEFAAGIAARDRLAQLLDLGFTVQDSGRTDRYGRTLATVVTAGGDVEAILVEEGLSLPYERGAEAREARRAHWCG